MDKFYEVFIKSFCNDKYINMNEKPNNIIKNIINNNITIITGFLNINRGNWKNHSRSAENYVDSFKKYLNYGYKMILYI